MYFFPLDTQNRLKWSWRKNYNSQVTESDWQNRYDRESTHFLSCKNHARQLPLNTYRTFSYAHMTRCTVIFIRKFLEAVSAKHFLHGKERKCAPWVLFSFLYKKNTPTPFTKLDPGSFLSLRVSLPPWFTSSLHYTWRLSIVSGHITVLRCFSRTWRTDPFFGTSG